MTRYQSQNDSLANWKPLMQRVDELETVVDVAVAVVEDLQKRMITMQDMLANLAGSANAHPAGTTDSTQESQEA